MQQTNKPATRIQLWLPILLSSILVVGILIGMRIQNPGPRLALENKIAEPNGGTNAQSGKIEQLLRYIEAKYVDEIDRDLLVDQAIKNILDQLDPHSSYIPVEELNAVTEQLEGNFDGIGVEFLILDDTVVVVTALSGGPAEQVGILAGDKIVQVEDSIVAGNGITNRGIISLLKGKKGETVKVGIIRAKDSKIKTFDIIRDRIPIKSIDVSYMLDDKTGFIKINRFAATTDREFLEALDQLTKAGMEDLVLDLRNNPGGYLQKATNMLNQLFTDKGELMVYTEGRSVNRADYKTTGSTVFKLGKVAALIDESSASAAEIMAGTIQDHDRGVIVGRRSFGKGLVQEQYRLQDGSALRLTVARYYTPSGRSIQKSYEDLDAYKNDFKDRFESGELLSSNNIKIQDSTRYYTQNGRIVYSGGGIIPDIFVPLDTQKMSDRHYQLRREIPNYVFTYLEENQETLNKLNLESFTDKFKVSKNELTNFVAFAQERNPDITEATLDPQIAKDLAKQLKARIGKQLFEEQGYYRVLFENDEMIQAALEALKSADPITQRTPFKD